MSSVNLSQGIQAIINLLTVI